MLNEQSRQSVKRDHIYFSYIKQNTFLLQEVRERFV